MEIPVYLITGFLESGKTTFIKTTLEDPSFADGGKMLLICCEEGEEEYDEAELAKKNVSLVTVEDFEDLTKEFLDDCQNRFRPKSVVVEVNGTWKMDEFLELDTPNDWVTVQIVTLVNAKTFANYLTNMRNMIMEQIKYADTVIFNRCAPDTKKMDIRKAVKPVNGKAQIIYETENGEELAEGEVELPYDINADIIDIEDGDFGLFYLDAMDFGSKYEGKKVRFKGQVYKDRKLPSGYFVPGRFAMTCCANDITFIGFYCRVKRSMKEQYEALINRDWVTVTGTVKLEFHRTYRGRGPVIFAESIESAEAPAESIVYFT